MVRPFEMTAISSAPTALPQILNTPGFKKVAPSIQVLIAGSILLSPILGVTELSMDACTIPAKPQQSEQSRNDSRYCRTQSMPTCWEAAALLPTA